MSDQNYIYKSAKAVGDGKGKNVGRAYRVEAKDFTQSAQASPVPVTWGAARRSGAFLFPIFRFRSKKIKEEAGK
jgi:hypothetical protein